MISAILSDAWRIYRERFSLIAMNLLYLLPVAIVSLLSGCVSRSSSLLAGGMWDAGSGRAPFCQSVEVETL